MAVTPAPTTCAACGRGTVVNGTCTSCGFASGEGNRCPHCGSVARVEPRGSGKGLRWVCGVCGGPRVPGGAGGPAAAQPLREAKASLSRARSAKASTFAFALMAIVFTLFALAVWPAALAWKLVFLAASVTPVLFATRAGGRKRAALADAKEAEDRAWLAAAEQIAQQSKQGVTVDELAARLQVDPARADALLTQLAVHDRTRIDVGEDAEVRYSVTAPEGGPRLRVDASVDDRFRALEEAERAAGENAELVTEEQAVLSNPFPTRTRR